MTARLVRPNERDRNRKPGEQTQRGGNEGSSNPNDQQRQREQQGQGSQAQQQQGGGKRHQQGGQNVGRDSERKREDELGQTGRATGRERDRQDR